MPLGSDLPEWLASAEGMSNALPISSPEDLIRMLSRRSKVHVRAGILDFVGVDIPSCSFEEAEAVFADPLGCKNLLKLIRDSKGKGKLVAVDNSLFSFCLFRPADVGVDIVTYLLPEALLCTAEKVALTGRTGRACSSLTREAVELCAKAARCSENASLVARFLFEHPKVESVSYPVLKSLKGRSIFPVGLVAKFANRRLAETFVREVDKRNPPMTFVKQAGSKVLLAVGAEDPEYLINLLFFSLEVI